MVTLLLCLALAWQFYLGYSRGVVKQGYLVLAAIVSFWLAKEHFQALADKLTLWVPYTQAVKEQTLTFFPDVSIFEMHRVFYAGVAFLVILLAVYLLCRLVGILLHLLPLNRYDQKPLNLLSGGLSVILTLFFWSVVFNLAATIPFDHVQDLLKGSSLMRLVINFPLLSSLLHHLWV